MLLLPYYVYNFNRDNKMMIKKSMLVLAIGLALSGCNDSTQTTQASKSTNAEATPAVEVAKTENQKLNELVETYFDESLAFSPVSGTYVGASQFNNQWTPVLTAENRKAYFDFIKQYQAKLEQIDSAQLTGQDLLSFEIFERDLKLTLESEQFPSYLIPIDQMAGEHNTFASLGSGKSAQAFTTKSEFDAFRARANSFVAWLESVEKNMREGVKQNVVLPKVLAKKLLPQFKAHAVSEHVESVFWMPVANMPSTISADDKVKIEAEYTAMINTVLVPAYAKMAAFLENEYIPAASEKVGYANLPNGKAWYEYLIKQHTTLALDADEIHEIGLKEVERILNEMKGVKEAVGFEGDLAAFFVHLRDSDEFYYDTPEALIAAYEEVKKKIDARVPKLFNIAPKADYIVKPVEAFRAASAAGASYQAPAPDGSRPGVFYINTHNLKAQPKFLLETLSIHEAAPGHHFQIALKQEVEGLPRFRKFGGYTVFAEGWALYAESLGKDLGLFTDPYMWYGRLVDEQLRAMRLVLDTGFHAKGWTREQGIAYMKANSSMAESDIISEVERYIGWPGQALSYKLGEFKIRELRDKAQSALGEKFDIKEFHTQILIDGALPMPILESKIDKWIASLKA